MQITPETHEQAMACLACGLAGWTPDEFFPQEPGPWDEPCPRCGANMVWVTEPREREDADPPQHGTQQAAERPRKAR
jgi:hypothetical protein